MKPSLTSLRWPHIFEKDTPVAEAKQTIANFGYVLVMDGEELAGIVTYTDLLADKQQRCR